MAVRNLPKRKRIEPRWVVSEAGEAVAVLVDIDEYNDMLRRLGEIATREEEQDTEALTLLEKAEADIQAGRLARHEEVVKAFRKRRRRK